MTLSAPSLTLERFTTPRGHAASMFTRPDTSDHNTLYSCLTEDEYGLRDIELGGGTAIDVGAHLGGVAIGLALDNPEATIIAVEALTDNVDVLQANVIANGVEDRVRIVHAIAGRPGQKQGTVHWNFEGGEAATHHRYIANAQNIDHLTSQTEQAKVVSLDALTPAAFMKIDCEGCEYELLRSPAVKDVAEIRGEFHRGFEEVVELLSATHDVYLTSGTEAFGGFKAVRR